MTYDLFVKNKMNLLSVKFKVRFSVYLLTLCTQNLSFRYNLLSDTEQSGRPLRGTNISLFPSGFRFQFVEDEEEGGVGDC